MQGYKQEFKRAFKPFEVFGVAFSIFGLFPSITSILFYSIPNGGALSMVWGWLVASFFILCIGFSMAELASAAPTSGGVHFPPQIPTSYSDGESVLHSYIIGLTR